jgi:hypothetical protein
VQETGRHQDHVIAHVIGATVLGFLIHDETAHLLLDIGFIWTILLDGEMGLVPQSMAIAELEVDADEKALLLADVERLNVEGHGAVQLARWTRAPVECLIVEVSFYASDARRRLLIKGEDASLVVESSLAAREIKVEESSRQDADSEIFDE